MSRWSPEQVAAVAPTPASLSAARPLTTITRWVGLGADASAVWGSCQGSGAEPYDTMVDHVGVGFRCTCPSRRHPCKHALALLQLWSRGDVVDVTTAPPRVVEWMTSRARAVAPHPSATGTGGGESSGSGSSTAVGSGVPADASVTGPADSSSAAPLDVVSADASSDSAGTSATGASSGSAAPGGSPDAASGDPSDHGDRPDDLDRARDERVQRMFAGLTELDRWLDDRIRTGLADPTLAKYATWDELAARLVDAGAGSLANRIRRLAGLVGTSPDWHGNVLAELGLLHLLSQAGRRLGTLPDPLADAVATTVGWQVRQADVLGGVPDTDHWVVAGRSDTREDRIEVRRHWLRGERSGRWALVLSFAAYRQSLDTSLTVGSVVHADLHRYPGPALRALVGERYGDLLPGAHPPADEIASACDAVGWMLADQPWLDRVPFTVRAGIAVVGDGWALSDPTGTLPILRTARSTLDRSAATLLAVSAGGEVDVTCEWTPHGVVPLTVHLDDRSIDIGPRADDSFVSAS